MIAIYINYPTVNRTATITSAFNNGLGQIRLTSAAHGLKTGDKVWIKGIGIPNTDGFWYITVPIISNVPSLNEFDLNNSFYTTGFTTGGTFKIGVWAVGSEGFKRLDLFHDENMEYMIKVNDISKLDKVYSDFSNSFSVPATDINNEIFRYFFDIDVAQEFSYNPNIKVECYLETDTMPYRYAVMQLESIKIKDNRVDSYTIGLFSSIIQLTDLFGEDKLADLDNPRNNTEAAPNGLSMYDYDNTAATFYQSISDQSFNGGATLTPMINYSDKKWTLEPSLSSVNTDIDLISDPSHAIRSEGVRPALRLIKIIEAIELKYKVQFSRDFLGRAEFMNLFMWLNRAEDFPASAFAHIPITNTFTVIYGDGSNIVPLPNGDIQVTMLDSFHFSDDLNATYSGYSTAYYTLTPQAGYTTIPYSVTVIDDVDGVPVYVSDIRTGTTSNLPATWNAAFRSIDPIYYTGIYRLLVKSSAPIIFDVDVQVMTGIITRNSSTGVVSSSIEDQKDSVNNIKSSASKISIAANIPDMKVTEFIQNIMKMFKLVIRPLPFSVYEPRQPYNINGKFYMTTLNSFYLQGGTVDLTEFIDFKEVNIRKPEVYKEILFKYLDTENFRGKAYKDRNIEGIGYGDLRISFGEDQVNTKNKLEVSVSFENMLFERLLNSSGELTNLMIGESISKDDNGATYDKNKSKAIIFYNIGISSIDNASPKTRFGADIYEDLVYPSIFASSNDMLTNQVTQSINFNPLNIDPWHKTTINQSLFETKWRQWIDEIYNYKQRKFAFKAVNLDPKTLKDLDLEDTVIIKDQRYKIEDMKLNLNTGDATLNLFKAVTSPPLPINFVSDNFISSDLYFVDYLSDENHVILYGNFSGTISQPSSNQLIKLNKAGIVVPEFNVGTGFSGPVPVFFSDLIRIGDFLYVTGNFTTYNGVTANKIAKINYYTGALDTTFRTNIGAGFNSPTLGIADAGDGIIVVGQYQFFNSVSHNRIIKLNYNGTVFPGWSSGSGFNDIVTDVVVMPDDSIVASGYFITYNGTTASRIARLQDTGGFINNVGSGITAVANTPIGLVPANPPNPSNPSFSLWVYGEITVFKGTVVNRLFLIDGITGNMISPLTGNIGPSGKIVHAQRVLGNKLLIQGEKTGFTTYNNVYTTSVIINNDGSIYESYSNTPRSFIYEIDDAFYSIALDSKQTSLEVDESIPLVNRTYILATPGEMYYGVTIQQKIGWYADVMDLGDGIDWIQFLNTNGTGLDECTFLVKTKILQTPPEVFNSRRAMVRLYFDNGTIRTILVEQQGILNIP